MSLTFSDPYLSGEDAAHIERLEDRAGTWQSPRTRAALLGVIVVATVTTGFLAGPSDSYEEGDPAIAMLPEASVTLPVVLLVVAASLFLYFKQVQAREALRRAGKARLITVEDSNEGRALRLIASELRRMEPEQRRALLPIWHTAREALELLERYPHNVEALALLLTQLSLVEEFAREGLARQATLEGESKRLLLAEEARSEEAAISALRKRAAEDRELLRLETEAFRAGSRRAWE